MMKKKGFVLLMVIGFMVILSVTILALMNISLNELRQGKAVNDWNSAFYAASAGAEIMYGHLRTLSGTTVTFPLALPLSDNVRTTGYGKTGGARVGSFEANTYVITPPPAPNTSGVLGIRSTGTVNGRSATVLVKYGYTQPITTGIPIGAGGNVNITLTEGPTNAGVTLPRFLNTIKLTCPIYANGSIVLSPTGSDHIELVNSSAEGAKKEGPGSVDLPDFWLSDSAKTNRDTNNDGNYVTDANGDGKITRADCGGDPVKIAIFDKDHLSSDPEINDKDAFIYYYTKHLNQTAEDSQNRPLELNPDEPDHSNYYSHNMTFTPAGNPLYDNQEIIFVDGDVRIPFGSAWAPHPAPLPYPDGYRCYYKTIVATGNIDVTSQESSLHDVVTYVAYGNVTFDTYMDAGCPKYYSQFYRPMKSPLIVYAGGNINITSGHHFWLSFDQAGASLLAVQDVNIKNIYDHQYDRYFPGDDRWPIKIELSPIDPSRVRYPPWVDPVGLPPGYKVVNIGFNLQERSDAPPSPLVPRWPKWQME